MKLFLKFAALSLLAAVIWACDDDKSYADPGKEVTAHNIAGTWRLAEWNNASLAEGSYVYIEFIRKDGLFKMYQNLDSFGARLRTGSFRIETDPARGSIIRGIYDNSMSQEWNHRYIVKDLTKDRMIWIATDDADDVSVYVRAEIPDEIINEASAKE